MSLPEVTTPPWAAAQTGQGVVDEELLHELDGLAALSDQDLEGLFDASTSEAGAEVGFDTGHLVSLARDLLRQYVDVIGGFVADVFSRADATSWASEVDTARKAMVSLADATGDQALAKALDELVPLIADAAPGKGRSRSRYLERVRAWVGDFAGLLHAEDADRLMHLVKAPSRGTPLMLRLADIPGIGARRLERLGLAGLHETDRLVASDPEEVAVVAGLTAALAARVIEEARKFAHEERVRALAELEDRARWLLEQPLDLGDPEIAAALVAARAALGTFLSSFDR